MVAGMMIGIGGMAYLLASNPVLGAFLFAVGLTSICVLNFNLFTGKLCYFLDDKTYLWRLPVILAGNTVGAMLMGILVSRTRFGGEIGVKAAYMVWTKITDTPASLFFLAFFCNMLIYLAVEGFRTRTGFGRYFILVLAVMTFILCGMEHSIADIFYMTVARAHFLHVLPAISMIILGNFLGGVFMRQAHLLASPQ